MARNLPKIMLLTALCLAMAVPALAELSAQKIVSNSMDREKGKNKIVEMEMIIQKGSSQKVRVFSQWQLETDKGSKKMIRFTAPAQMKGTAFLSWENKDRDDDQWLFMASRKQVRRIASSDKTAAFLGSDLTYEDMGELKVDERTHKILDTPTLNGRKCWLIESVAKPETKSGYASAKTYFDQETFIPLKMETFDQNGKPIKDIVCEEYKNVDGVWTMIKVVVTPASKMTSTTLLIKSVKYDVDLPAAKFNKESLSKY